MIPLIHRKGFFGFSQIMASEHERTDDSHEEDVATPSTSSGTGIKENIGNSGERMENRKSPGSGGSSRSTSKSRTPPMRARNEGIPMKLRSPVAGEFFTYYWPLRESASYSEGSEIIETIKETLTFFPELRCVFEKNINIEAIDKRSKDDMDLLIDKYNDVITISSKLWKGATKPGGEIWSTERADPDLLKRIRNRAYNRAVENVNLLNNHYKAFSSETYGETSFERLQMIIQEILPKERDIFVDLGSGVGQLVVQMAGGSKVKKAVGIEIAGVPNRYAQNLADEFKKWMKWYGKKFRPFELIHGDFLDERFRDLITKDATIIFINNFAFTAELETRIKRELLADLKDGTRIISTKPYGHTNRTITDRHMNDISAILDMYEMAECENACSWTGNYVPYFHHTINRARLENYYFLKSNPALKFVCNGSDGRRSSTSSKNSREMCSRESSVSAARAGTPNHVSSNGHLAHEGSMVKTGEEDDKDAKGPTTRSKWHEYVSKGHPPKRASKIAREAVDVEMAGAIRKRDASGDADYIPPPAAKKYKKTGGVRGRPRKTALLPKAFAEDRNEPLDTLHALTHAATANASISQEVDASLVRADIASPTYSTISSVTQPGTLHNGIQPSKYPALDQAIDEIRSYYEGLLDAMYNNKDDFVARLKAEVNDQLTYRNALLARKEGLERSVTTLLSIGVTKLRLRLEELDIEPSSPAHLLERAKEIVEHHKKITATCAAMESEITSLELANQQLDAKVKEQREISNGNLLPGSDILASAGVGVPATPVLGNSDFPADKNQFLRVFKNSLNKVDALASMAEPSSSEAMPQTRGSLVSPQSDAMGGHGITAAVPGSFGAQAAPLNVKQRTRSRSTRGSSSSKRLALNANKQAADPVEEEEMQRTIQHIVAKALEVDCAAKCAEKERRARGDKRKEKASTSSSSTAAGQRVEEVPVPATIESSSSVYAAAAGNAADSSAMMLSPPSSFEGGNMYLSSEAHRNTPDTDSIRSEED